jgi:transaldolase
MPTFFLDSAERETVTKLLATGLFGGVTTNPAILDKAGLGSADIPDYVKWATDAGAKLSSRSRGAPRSANSSTVGSGSAPSARTSW